MTDVNCLDLLAQEPGFVLKLEQREALELLLRGKEGFCVLPTALFIRCLFMERVIIHFILRGRDTHIDFLWSA